MVLKHLPFEQRCIDDRPFHFLFFFLLLLLLIYGSTHAYVPANTYDIVIQEFIRIISQFHPKMTNVTNATTPKTAKRTLVVATDSAMAELSLR
jgi:hypothetical protein